MRKAYAASVSSFTSLDLSTMALTVTSCCSIRIPICKNILELISYGVCLDPHLRSIQIVLPEFVPFSKGLAVCLALSGRLLVSLHTELT